MMQNVQTKITGSNLVITIDLAQNLGPSKTGKNDKVASTGGNVPIGDASGAVLGLNVYKPRK